MRSWRLTRRETLFTHRLFALHRDSLAADPAGMAATTDLQIGRAHV